MVEKKRTPKRRAAPSDFGAPIDGFFATPDARSSLEWGMPFYAIDGQMTCALAGFKAHVNLILAGLPEAVPDPKGRLEGDGKDGRQLKLRALVQLPKADVKRWLKIARKLPKAKAKAGGLDPKAER